MWKQNIHTLLTFVTWLQKEDSEFFSTEGTWNDKPFWRQFGNINRYFPHHLDTNFKTISKVDNVDNQMCRHVCKDSHQSRFYKEQ